jgi:toxin ParE1/3/4
MTVKYAVILSPNAASDLIDIHDYISRNDAPAKADHVIDKIEEVVQGLALFPERGAITKELLEMGIRNYRETYFKPYRVIYEVSVKQVFIHLVADGRREMQTLLQKRLLRP